jgi:mono/diheme cytochrome c family protein
MWKGKAFTRFTAGAFVVAMAACAGGDEGPDTAGGDAAAPPPTTAAPGPATPGADPTTAPTPGATTPSPAAGGTAAGGELVAQGQQAYQSSVCVSCHGPNGTGTPLAPALNDNEWLWVEAGADMQTQITTIIKTGVSQPKDPAHVAPMLPYGGVPIDDAQVDAIAAYIVSISQGG